jgi:serine O-acetyltransferase
MIINRVIWGAYIPAACTLGKGTKFAYGGSGVVIHSDSIVGVNCNIGTGVTIGGRGNHSKGTHTPIIGNNVYIGTGAKILGAVRIGSNVVIGANAVVINNVEDNVVVAGIPAKVIRKNIDASEYS